MLPNASPLAPHPPQRAQRRMRVPLIILALLIAALFAEIGFTRFALNSNILLLHRTANGWQTVPAPRGFPEKLRVSPNGTVWLLSMDSGLSHWDGTAWQPAPDFTRHPGYWRQDFALDRGQVWAPSRGGMLHWDGAMWSVDPSVTTSLGPSIVAGNGEAWVIDPNGKFSHFASGHWHSQTLAIPGIDWNENVWTRRPKLARSADGTLWLQRKRLFRFDGANWTAAPAARDAQQDARLIGAAGDRVWLSDDSGLRAISLDGNQSTLYSKRQIGLEPDKEITLAASAGPNTYFDTNGAPLEFDGSHWTKIPVPDRGVVATISGGADGSLWIAGTKASQYSALFKYVAYLIIVTPFAILAVLIWALLRYRRRRIDQHQRVTEAVEHATGEVPAELEAGARNLKLTSGFTILVLIAGTLVCYALLRKVWPHAPYWTIAVIGLALHLLLTFQQSLVKRKAKASDPIGPGAPSRYDWAKSWQTLAGAAAIVLFAYADHLPMLSFLRGYWLWIFVFGPVVYQAVATRLFAAAARRGDYDAAIKIIRWANFYNPWGVEQRRISGRMLLLAGRYPEAEETLRRSLASSQARESYASALEHLGDALAEQGRYNEATRSYEAALLAFPWRRRTYRGMAEMALRRGQKPEQALEWIEKIVDFSGLSWRQRQANGKVQDDYWSLKAWALACLGRASDAAAAIENALRHTNKSSAPDMAATHYRAGMAMQALSNEPAAREHFKMAIQYDPHGRRGLLAQAALHAIDLRRTVPA
jgi:tetratricopeptide (TPR) repeat protein